MLYEISSLKEFFNLPVSTQVTLVRDEDNEVIHEGGSYIEFIYFIRQLSESGDTESYSISAVAADDDEGNSYNFVGDYSYMTATELTEKLFSERLKKQLAKSNVMNTVNVFKTVLETVMSHQNIAFHSEDEEGSIENYFFFWEDGQLLMDYDCRRLNNDGIRYLDTSYENEPASLKDLIFIIRNSDDYIWSLGWSNVDCDL